MTMMPWRTPFDIPHLSFEEALALLKSSHKLGMCPLLETVIDMLDELARPDSHYDVIQIAGTNGKTSTSRFLAALLQEAHYQVGLYTSPSLVDMRERIELCGELCTTNDFSFGVSAAWQAGERINSKRKQAGKAPYDITEFDLLTVAALVIFAKREINVAVLEVGLGGRWDATTATHPIMSLITGIDYDHTHVLGNTLTKIAQEKAAIIKPHQKVVLGPWCFNNAEVAEVFLSRVREQGAACVTLRNETHDAPLLPTVRDAILHIDKAPAHVEDSLVFSVATSEAVYRGISINKPVYQAANAAQALVAAQCYVGHPLNQVAVQYALATCETPARFQIVKKDPLQIVDAAHNPQSVRVTLESVKAYWPQKQQRPALLAAVLADKDYEAMVYEMAATFSTIYVCQTMSERALLADTLQEQFRKAGAQVAGTYPSVSSAYSELKDTSFIALGSITLAADLFATIRDSK